MRRIGMIVVVLAAMALSGCRPLVEPDDALNLYATFYPIYALTDAVISGVPETSLHCLAQPQDGCLRSYGQSDWDLYLLSQADAVIAGGRGLESFEKMLFSLGDRGPAATALFYDLELYSMDDYQGSVFGAREDSHLQGDNPHLYMSVDGAVRIVQSVAASMTALDPRYAEQYEANAEGALSALETLRLEARDAAGNVAGRRVALMNEALIYVARDHELDPVVWVDRESGEALYADQLDACLDALRQAEVEVVLIERQAPASLTEALRAAGFRVALIDILSTHREGEGFDTYMEAQMNNARAIARAFSEIEA